MEWGRPISGSAYAWYVRGVVAQHHDRVQEARYSFVRAMHEDPAGAAAYAALIGLECEARPSSAEQYLKYGVEKATRPGVVVGAAAACALRNDDRALARSLAERALRLEPLLPSANRTYAAVLALSGDGQRATRWRRAYRLAMQHSSLTQGPLSTSSGEWRVGAGMTPSAELPLRSRALEAVDTALFRENLVEAQRAATMLVSPGELAARALGWGKLSLARAQAVLVNDADPIDPDARIVLFLLHHRDDSSEEPRGCCEDTAASKQPSLISKLLLTREIERTIGRALAEQLLASDARAISTSTDPLVRQLARLD